MTDHEDQQPDQPDKNAILDALAKKPVQRFLQIDGFVNCHPDDSTSGDDEGDMTMLGITHELMQSPGRDLPVRVLIHEDADHEDVRRLLAKMLDGLDDCLDSFDSWPSPSSPPPF